MPLDAAAPVVRGSTHNILLEAQTWRCSSIGVTRLSRRTTTARIFEQQTCNQVQAVLPRRCRGWHTTGAGRGCLLCTGAACSENNCLHHVHTCMHSLQLGGHVNQASHGLHHCCHPGTPPVAAAATQQQDPALKSLLREVPAVTRKAGLLRRAETGEFMPQL